MDINQYLQEIGLSEKEATAYMAAVELGRFSIGSLATKSKIKRTTCYLVVNTLTKRGLISVVPQARKTLYVAEPPKSLMAELNRKSKILGSILEPLEKMAAKNKAQPIIKFYTGQRGVRAIYDDIYNSADKACYSVFSTESLFGVTGKEFLDDWVRRRAEKGIYAYSIVVKQKNKKLYPIDDNPELLRELRYLPHDITIPGSIVAYSNKVAFISSKEDDFSFTVRSEEFFQTAKGIFDALWKYVATKE